MSNLYPVIGDAAFRPRIPEPHRKSTGLVQVDRSLPFAQHLKAAWFFNGFAEFFGKNPLSVGVGTPTFTGPRGDFALTETFVTAVDPPGITGLSELTVLFRCNNRTPSSSGDPIGMEGGNARNWNITTESGASSQMGFFKNNSGGDPNATFAANSWLADQMATYVVRWDGQATANITLWRSDGYFENVVDAATGTFVADSGMNLYIGDQDILFEFVAIFDLALPDAICQRLAFDTYHYFRSAADVVPVSFVTVGDITVPVPLGPVW